MDKDASGAPHIEADPIDRYFQAMSAALHILADELDRLERLPGPRDPVFQDQLHYLEAMTRSLAQDRDAALLASSSWSEAAKRWRVEASAELNRGLIAATGLDAGPKKVGNILADYLGQIQLFSKESEGMALPPTATLNTPATKGTMLSRPKTLSSRFEAYPRLAVDRPLVTKEAFRIVVGFSDRADADADFITPVKVDDANPDETMDVLISVSGATLSGKWKVPLALNLAAEKALAATVDTGATQVKLSASYLFRQRLVGTISKTIAVDGAAQVGSQPIAAATTPPPPAAAASPETPSWLPALGDADAIEAIDIFLIVQSQQPDSLEWKAYVTKTGQAEGPFSVTVRDTTAFAKKLAGIATASGAQEDDGLLDVIDVGQTVSALIPPAIVDEVLTPALASNGTPTVLLFADEPFIPWELARLSAAQANRPQAAFLGEVVRMGRWWLRASSTGPASQMKVDRMSAVAASTYDDGTNDTLEHAIAERKFLVMKYRAENVEARREPVRKWLSRSPSPGHLAHFALHGYSNPDSQEEGLILGDGTNLTPIRLSGEWNPGQIPRFAFVFLNACQVGTAGRRLGQMSGFPGVLIRNGVSGFIAPLWEVNDKFAGQLAEALYKRTLDDQVAVGEALRSLRAEPRIGKSITPLAYVYYGHPTLRLARRRTVA